MTKKKICICRYHGENPQRTRDIYLIRVMNFIYVCVESRKLVFDECDKHYSCFCLIK